MVLEASRKNGVIFFKVATLQRQAHLQPCNVPFSGSDKVWTGLQGCPFQRTALAPRRAQNLLAGCIFDGLACQKCFCVTLGKSNRTSSSQVSYRSQPRRLTFSLTSLLVLSSKSHASLPTFCRKLGLKI